MLTTLLAVASLSKLELAKEIPGCPDWDRLWRCHEMSVPLVLYQRTSTRAMATSSWDTNQVLAIPKAESEGSFRDSSHLEIPRWSFNQLTVNTYPLGSLSQNWLTALFRATVRTYPTWPTGQVFQELSREGAGPVAAAVAMVAIHTTHLVVTKSDLDWRLFARLRIAASPCDEASLDLEFMCAIIYLLCVAQ